MSQGSRASAFHAENQPAVRRAPCPKSAKRDPKRPNGVDAGGQRVNDEEGDHPGPGAGVQSDSDRSRAAGPEGRKRGSFIHPSGFHLRSESRPLPAHFLSEVSAHI